MLKSEKTLSTVQFRFWALVVLIFLLAVTSSALAVRFTATPFMLAQQQRLVTHVALQEARSLEAVLARHRWFLDYVASDTDLVNVVVGYVENSDVVRDNLELLKRPNSLSWVGLYDAFGAEVAQMHYRTEDKLIFGNNQISEFVEDFAKSEANASQHVALEVADGLAHILMAVPVTHHGFVEGALVAGFRINPDRVFPSSALAQSTLIVSLEDLPSALENAPSQSQSIKLADSNLAVVLLPDVEVVEAAGNTLVKRTASSVALVLFGAFSLFACLGRAALIEPHNALEKQKKSLAELASIAMRANDAINVTNMDGKVIWNNPAFEELTGYSAAEIRSKRAGDVLQGPDTDPAAALKIHNAILTKTPIKTEILNYHKTGRTYWASISLTPLENEGGEIYGFVSISNDVTDARRQQDAILEAKAEIERQALHDPLTGLANRRALDIELRRRAKLPEPAASIVRIDLDHFKYVNDTMGHEAGDFVLCEVARILRAETKSGDLPVRVGGDEFVILLEAGRSSSDGIALAERMLQRIKAPKEFNSKTIRLGASFGVASTMDNILPMDELIVGADAALYQAKDMGRNQVRHYASELHTYVQGRRLLARELRRAISREEFVPFFQPQIDAETFEIVGVETLVRWASSEFGLLFPDEFLPIAEQLSAVDDIDAIVFRKAINQISDLIIESVPIPKLSFNVTAERIQSTSFFDALANRPKYAPKIAFEILESVLVEDQSDLFNFSIDRLREMGASIEIDDFGSGHASIVGLMHLSPDVMKIDKQLVLPIVDSEIAQGMVQQIVGMANLMGLRVTAEGVETLSHAEILRDLGCHTLQGYAFAKAMPLDELRGFVQNWQGMDYKRRVLRTREAS